MTPRERSPLAALFVTVFVDLLGFGLTIPVIPFYAQRFHVGSLGVTMISASYSLMQFLFVPLWAALSDRVGRRPVMLASIAATAVFMPLLGLSNSYAMLLLVRLAQGIATANIATAQAYIADITTPETRARGMGVMGAAFGLGFILGPFVGGVLSQHVHKAAPGIAAGIIAAINFVMALRSLPESLPVERRVQGKRALTAMREQIALGPLRAVLGAENRQRAVLVTVFGLQVLSFVNVETTFPLYMCNRFGYAEGETGSLFAYIGVVVAVIQGALIGKLTKRFGEVKLVRTALVSLCFGLAWLVVIPQLVTASACTGVSVSQFFSRVVWVLPSLTFMSLGNALFTPSMSALTSRAAPPGEQGLALGVQQSAGALSRVIGPIIGGAMYDSLSPRAPYIFAVAVMVVGLLYSSRFVQPQASPAART